MLRTERLLLRGWTQDDLEPFAALNADPAVMEHFLAPLTRDASDAWVARVQAAVEARGWGMWALEVAAGTDAGRFAGFVGLQPLAPELPPAPGIEIGWRLARWAWGRGYASEAARAALTYAFATLGAEEVVAITSVHNLRSQAVMQRIGMRVDPSREFDNPRLPPGHRLERHVLWAVRPGAARSG